MDLIRVVFENSLLVKRRVIVDGLDVFFMNVKLFFFSRTFLELLILIVFIRMIKLFIILIYVDE